MQVLKNMSIAAKLSAAFGLVLALLVLLALFAFSRLQQVQAESHEISSNWLPSVREINSLAGDIVEYRIALIVHLNATDPNQASSSLKSMEDADTAAKQDMEDYKKLISSDKERADFERFLSLWQKYQGLAKQVVGLLRESKTDEARNIVGGEARQAFTDANAVLRQLVDLNNKGADDAAVHSDAIYSSATWMLLLVSLIAVSLGAVLAYTLIKAITGPLSEAVKAADRVAGGDLSQPIPLNGGKDETARLLEAMQRMQEALVHTVSNVRGGSESVATASAEIAQGNTDLSARTEEQASSLEETSATMEELSSTVRQNADNAQQANQLAQSASEVARNGGQVVGEVVTTMRGIEDSSKRISDIIATIDGIAFQTNILALNAAVEAARAGEQGRGFAVVAGEVRTLAQRSAEAAKEIKSLINDSVERVQSGTQLVDRAGQTMQDIVTSVQRVADIVGEISSASTEQSAGIAQVGEAVSQLDRATQQNAALVEESAAASESLKAQAARLLESVASFRLSSAQGRVAPPPPPKRAAAKDAPMRPATSVSKAPAAKPKPMAVTPKPANAVTAAPPAAPRPAPKREAAEEADGDWTTF